MMLFQRFVFMMLIGCLHCGADYSITQNEFVFSVPYMGVSLIHPVRIWITTTSLDPVFTSLTIPGVGYEANNTISKDNPAKIRLPISIDGNDLRLKLRDGKQNKTFVVRASSNVSVYAVDNERSHGDGFVVFRASQLGTQYRVASYKPYLQAYPSFICISAPYANTSVKIKTPTGQEDHITLKEYESYRFDAENAEDLSGTLVQSDKPVAVISAIRTQVPESVLGRGSLIEQLPPVQSWGYTFTLTPFLSLNSGYVYRVYTANVATSLRMSNGNVTYIEAGYFYEESVVNDTMVSFTSDQPIMVAQYMKGSHANNPFRGNPSMIIIPPMESFIGNVTFPIFEYTSLYPQHIYYINVVAECNLLDGLALDDSPISEDALIKSLDESICCFRQSLSSESHHTVSHIDPMARFFVSVYSVTSGSSYTYAANTIDAPGHIRPNPSESSHTTSPQIISSSTELTKVFAGEFKLDTETGFLVVGIAVIAVLIWILMVCLVLRGRQKRQHPITPKNGNRVKRPFVPTAEGQTTDGDDNMTMVQSQC